MFFYFAEGISSVVRMISFLIGSHADQNKLYFPELLLTFDELFSCFTSKLLRTGKQNKNIQAINGLFLFFVAFIIRSEM